MPLASAVLFIEVTSVKYFLMVSSELKDFSGLQTSLKCCRRPMKVDKLYPDQELSPILNARLSPAAAAELAGELLEVLVCDVVDDMIQFDFSLNLISY